MTTSHYARDSGQNVYEKTKEIEWTELIKDQISTRKEELEKIKEEEDAKKEEAELMKSRRLKTAEELKQEEKDRKERQEKEEENKQLRRKEKKRIAEAKAKMPGTIRIAFFERSCGNMLFYILYRFLRVVYVSVWFPYSPVAVVALQIYYPYLYA